MFVLFPVFFGFFWFFGWKGWWWVCVGGGYFEFFFEWYICILPLASLPLV